MRNNPVLIAGIDRLARKQADKSGSDKAKDFPNEINRIEIEELVRFVNQRPVVLLSRRENGADATPNPPMRSSSELR